MTTQLRHSATTAVIAVLAMVLLCLAVAPAGAATGDDFATLVRDQQLRAKARVRAAEEAAPAGRYPYFTIGDFWHRVGPNGWAAGYWPGQLWSFYQLTGGGWWRDAALRRQAAIAAAVTQDAPTVGGLVVPSYVRGYRLTGDATLRDTALEAASLVARHYDPSVGAMLSRPGAEYNVIIDSLLKTQLLWWAAKNGGSPEYAHIACQHALTIARDFVRPDGSTYHMVYYDATTGAVLRKETSSGYSHDSTWSRGQAWAILGFTAAYRETRYPPLLETARKVTDRYLADLPDDMVPFWDFQAPDIPLAPRDSSAAAIAAEGLIDLSLVEPDAARGRLYADAAKATIASLMSPSYASLGANPAVLLHGTYSYVAGIYDRGLAYGDAYFLEALLHLRRLPGEPALKVACVRAGAGKPRLAVDRDFDTSWAAAGAQSLDLRLAGEQEVGAVRLALFRGESRAARVRVLTSPDGRRWELATQTMTSGETAGFETLGFAPRPALWVRVETDGTTRGPICRIAEVRVLPAP
jgi:unsaturated chondroitin disaccharide hydrolase